MRQFSTIQRRLAVGAFLITAGPVAMGSVAYACLNRTAQVKTVDGRTPSEIGVGCDMTGGSSGGPWLIGVQANGLGYVNSVTSNGSDASPQMHGPYQGATAQALFAAVQAL